MTRANATFVPIPRFRAWETEPTGPWEPADRHEPRSASEQGHRFRFGRVRERVEIRYEFADLVVETAGQIP